MHRPNQRKLEEHEVDLDKTPPGSPIGWPIMASSPRTSAIPFLIPDIGIWEGSTPSLLSCDLDSSGDSNWSKNATFAIDSYVAPPLHLRGAQSTW